MVEWKKRRGDGKKKECKEKKKKTLPELNVDLLLTATQEGMHGAKVEQVVFC
jgi:hypothetical protein